MHYMCQRGDHADHVWPTRLQSAQLMHPSPGAGVPGWRLAQAQGAGAGAGNHSSITRELVGLGSGALVWGLVCVVFWNQTAGSGAGSTTQGCCCTYGVDKFTQAGTRGQLAQMAGSLAVR